MSPTVSTLFNHPKIPVTHSLILFQYQKCPQNSQKRGSKNRKTKLTNQMSAEEEASSSSDEDSEESESDSEERAAVAAAKAKAKAAAETPSKDTSDEEDSGDEESSGARGRRAAAVAADEDEGLSDLEDTQHHVRNLSASQLKRRQSLRKTSAVLDRILDRAGGFDADGEGGRSRSHSRSGSRSSSRRGSRSGSRSGSEGTGPEDEESVVVADENSGLMTAKEEMTLLFGLKDKVLSAWETIDVSGNGDVDRDEWCQGLVSFTPAISVFEAGKLFDQMDVDDSGFVEKHDMLTLCFVAFHNPMLKGLQKRIMDKVNSIDLGGSADSAGVSDSRRAHGRLTSIAKAEDVAEISDDELATMAAEMKHALIQQAQELDQALMQDETFFEDLQREATKEGFAQAENAPQWTTKEVAFWMDQMDPGSTGKLAKAVIDHDIDGSRLLNDVGSAVLSADLGVGHLSIGPIIRAIDELRKMHQVSLTNPYQDWKKLRNENDELKTTLKQLRMEMSDLELEKGELLLKLSSQEDGGGLFDGLLPPEVTVTTAPRKDTVKSELLIPLAEYERVCLEKIELVTSTAKELYSLRCALKVYQADIAALTGVTPGKRPYNPIDDIVGAMGYKPA